MSDRHARISEQELSMMANLQRSEILVYIQIKRFCWVSGTSTDLSNAQFTKSTGVRDRSVTKAIASLSKMGAIKSETLTVTEDGKTRTFRTITLLDPPSCNALPPVPECATSPSYSAPSPRPVGRGVPVLECAPPPVPECGLLITEELRTEREEAEEKTEEKRKAEEEKNPPTPQSPEAVESLEPRARKSVLPEDRWTRLNHEKVNQFVKAGLPKDHDPSKTTWKKMVN